MNRPNNVALVRQTGPGEDEPTTSDEVELRFGHTVGEISNCQIQDQDLNLLLKWLKSKVEPTEGVLALSSPAAKSYWMNRELFYLSQELLYRISNKSDNHQPLLVVPKSFQPEILKLSHSVRASGHLGISKTVERVKARFYWYGVSRDVKEYVASCSTCNVNKKPTKHARAALTKYHSGSPMERVHLDFMGPLPLTPRGNSHLLVMVDQFSKWIEIVPLPSQTAAVTAKAAVDSFFARFGNPFQIHSDQGRNFESKLFEALCQMLQIHKTRTTPYRPSSNGQVERYNRTLTQMIRCHIDSQKNWDEHLQQLAGAVRSSVNRHTGYTANMMMLGREVNTPADLMFTSDSPQLPQDPSDYVQQLRSTLQEVHSLARKHLQTSLERMKKDYDLRVREHTYKVGDVVYWLQSATKKGKCKKLTPAWSGPGVVIQQITPYLYRVKHKNKESVKHHDKLKLCRDRDVPKWLEKLRQELGTKTNNPEIRDPRASMGEGSIPDDIEDFGLESFFTPLY